jgi:hypothetical protein
MICDAVHDMSQSVWQPLAREGGFSWKWTRSMNRKGTWMSDVAMSQSKVVSSRMTLMLKNAVKNEKNGRCQKKSESPLSNGLTGGHTS